MSQGRAILAIAIRTLTQSPIVNSQDLLEKDLVSRGEHSLTESDNATQPRFCSNAGTLSTRLVSLKPNFRPTHSLFFTNTHLKTPSQIMDIMSTIEGIGFHLKLSTWDQRFPPMYSKRIIFFACPELPSGNHSTLISALEATLQLTMQDLSFLTGTVGPIEGRPWLFRLRPGGSIVLIINDLREEVGYRDLQQAGFPSALVDATKLCPYYKSMYVGESGLPVCALRLNLLSGGGVALVLQIVHTACDGRGITAYHKNLLRKG